MDADISEIVEYLIKNTPEKLIQKAVSLKRVQKKIIELNTNQLRRFKDSTGRDLADVGGEYAELTQQLKGVGARDIDLNDTGAYYKTLTIVSLGNEIAIDSDPIKVDFDGAVSLEERWGEDITGLSEKDTKTANEIIEEEIWNKAQKSI